MNRSLAISCALCFAASALGGHLIRKSGAADGSDLSGDAPPKETPIVSAIPAGGMSINALLTDLNRTTSAADFARLLNSSAITGRDQRTLIMMRWADVDPRAAFEFMRDGDSSFTHQHVKIVFLAWGRIDPEAAFANCIGFRSGGTEAAASKAALDGAFENDPDRAFTLFFETHKQLRSSAEFHAHGGVFEHPELTLTMIQKHGRDSRWRSNAQMFLLGTFAERDPQGLLAWSRNHLDGLGRDVGSIIRRLAESADPSLAMELFSELPPERITPGMVSSVASVLAKSDPAAALEFVEQRTKGKARADTQVSMLSAFASQDPAAAASAIKDFLADGGRAPNAVRHLMETWAESSPREAIVWTQTLEPGGARRRAEEALASEWFQRDQDEVSAFINQASVDEVSAAFLSSIATGGPLRLGSDGNNRRFEWLRAMPEHHSRRVIGEVFEATAKDDPRLAVSEVIRFDSTELRTAAVGALLESKLGVADGKLAEIVTAQEDTQLREAFLAALGDPTLDAERAAAVAAQIRGAD